jgi:hypothetical protein
MVPVGYSLISESMSCLASSRFHTYSRWKAGYEELVLVDLLEDGGDLHGVLLLLTLDGIGHDREPARCSLAFM